MSWIQAILWGFIQGVTDFLPVSSSAHLAMLEHVFGLQEAITKHCLFYAMLEFGVLFVIVVNYRKELVRIFRALRVGAPTADRRGKDDRAERRLMLLIAVGCLPLLLGLFLGKWAGQMRTSCLFCAAAWIVSGMSLFYCDYLPGREKTQQQMKLADAFWIGAGQTLSVLPGLSRTGLTIAFGYSRRLRPSFAFTYSFLLSIPFLFVSVIVHTVQAIRFGVERGMVPRYLVGMAVCILIGFIAIQVFRRIAERKKLRIFSYYCWGAAAFSFFLFLIT